MEQHRPFLTIPRLDCNQSQYNRSLDNSIVRFRYLQLMSIQWFDSEPLNIQAPASWYHAFTHIWTSFTVSVKSNPVISVKMERLFHLKTYSTHFTYGCIVGDMWRKTTQGCHSLLSLISRKSPFIRTIHDTLYTIVWYLLKFDSGTRYASESIHVSFFCFLMIFLFF